MKIINNIIFFFVVLFVGSKLQEVTMNKLYPNRLKRGLINNFIYDWRDWREKKK